jgi:hypothetical protein
LRRARFAGGLYEARRPTWAGRVLTSAL